VLSAARDDHEFELDGRHDVSHNFETGGTPPRTYTASNTSGRAQRVLARIATTGPGASDVGAMSTPKIAPYHRSASQRTAPLRRKSDRRLASTVARVVGGTRPDELRRAEGAKVPLTRRRVRLDATHELASR